MARGGTSVAHGSHTTAPPDVLYSGVDRGAAVSQPSSPQGVESAAERAFLDRFYRLGAIGRAVLAGLVVAVALGLVGTGPISWSDATDGDLTVSYERFLRRGAPWTMQVDVAASPDGTAHIVLGREFHGNHQLTSITPQPDSVSVSPDVVTYVFATGSTGRHVTVDFHFTADALGWGPGEVGVAGAGPRVTFRQLMYP